MSDSIMQATLNKTRADKFIFVLTLPKAMREIDTKENPRRLDDIVQSDALQFSVYGSVVPSIRVPEVQTPYSGQTFKFSSHNRPSYDNVSLQFDIDNLYNNWWVIWKWLDILNNSKVGTFDVYDDPSSKPMHEKYSSNCTLYGVDEYNANKIKYTYVGVVPVGLGAIDYNERDATIIKSSFEFSFSQLLVELL